MFLLQKDPSFFVFLSIYLVICIVAFILSQVPLVDTDYLLAFGKTEERENLALNIHWNRSLQSRLIGTIYNTYLNLDQNSHQMRNLGFTNIWVSTRLSTIVFLFRNGCRFTERPSLTWCLQNNHVIMTSS